jgi:GNAT superfamily N-acetyltransferase
MSSPGSTERLVVTLREATAADAPVIAALHADSWQRNYRGAYPDAFLDHEVHEERALVWQDRLATPNGDRVTVLAEHDGRLVGFAHLVFDEDSTWGTLLDNLHVTHGLKRSGVGTTLLADAARRVVRRDAKGLLYLWVLEQNRAAQAFYLALRGDIVERRDRSPQPGFALRCVWREPSGLAQRRAL